MLSIFKVILKKIRAIRLRQQDRNFLSMVKLAEIKLFKSKASTYCYNFPSHVILEVTSKCNLRCVWCQQADSNWRTNNWGDIDFEDAKKILPSLKGVQVLLLFNIGEPLLYKKLFELIKEARNVIPKVRITTNGTLLTKEKSLKLEEAGLTQLNVSIDSPDPDVFKRVRDADLNLITENLKEFCEVTKIPLHIWSVISSETVESLKMLPEYAAGLQNCEQLYFQLVHGFDLATKAGIDMALSEEKFNEFRDLILTKCEKYGLRTNLEYVGYYPPGFFTQQADVVCTMLTTSLISINCKGEINPCCAYRERGLETVFGENGFRGAWNSSNVRSWRKQMLEQDYPGYCRNWCGYGSSQKKDLP